MQVYAAGFTDDETRKYGTMVDGHMTFQLWVIGCVDYLFADRKEHHQTGFVYRIAYQSFVARLESGQRRVEVVEFLDLAEVLGFDPAKAVSALRKTS